MNVDTLTFWASSIGVFSQGRCCAENTVENAGGV